MSRWLRLPIGVASVLLFVAHFSGLALAAEVKVSATWFASNARSFWFDCDTITRLKTSYGRMDGDDLVQNGCSWMSRCIIKSCEIPLQQTHDPGSVRSRGASALCALHAKTARRNYTNV